ncbi:MAG: hypothetical protein RR327_05060 [Clostridia bacterium]
MSNFISCVTAILRRTPNAYFRGAKVFFWASKSGMSWCGSIYINSTSSQEMLRHEFGHTLQYKYLGFWRYVTDVAIPSLIGIYKYRKTARTYDDHIIYEKIKSEAEANQLGGNKFWQDNVLQDALTDNQIKEILIKKER